MNVLSRLMRTLYVPLSLFFKIFISPTPLSFHSFSSPLVSNRYSFARLYTGKRKITAKSASMYADRPFTNLADNLVRKFAIRSDLQFQEQFFVFFQCFEIDIYLGKVDDRFKMNVRTCGSFVRCLSSNYIRRLLTLSLMIIDTQKHGKINKLPFHCSLCTFDDKMNKI